MANKRWWEIVVVTPYGDDHWDYCRSEGLDPEQTLRCPTLESALEYRRQRIEAGGRVEIRDLMGFFKPYWVISGLADDASREGV